MAVRRATSADAAAIAGVQVRGWQSGYRGLVPDAILDAMSVAERTARWREILSRVDASTYTLVTERADELLGFCSIIAPSRDDDASARTAEIAAIYVEPALWRAGAGGTLLRVALDNLRRDDWRDVSLWVFAANDRARSFYARFGFHADGREIVDAPSGQTEVRLRTALTGDDGQ